MGKIVINGRIPSKKNSTVAMARGKRIFHFANSSYRTWNKDAILQLVKQNKFIESKRIELHFYFPDNRKTDLTNKAESVMDTLVDGGCLHDDNCCEVSELVLKYEGVDKVNPRCEIVW